MSVTNCPACLGENFKERELIPGLLEIKTCVQCGLLINDSKKIHTPVKVCKLADVRSKLK